MLKQDHLQLMQELEMFYLETELDMHLTTKHSMQIIQQTVSTK